MSYVKRTGFHKTLAFRIIGGSLLGFLLASLVSLFVLDRFLNAYLMRRVDRMLKTEAVDLAATLERMGSPLPTEAVRLELTRFGHTRGIHSQFIRLFSAEGTLLAHSNLEPWPSLTEADPPVRAGQSDFFYWRNFSSPQRPRGVRALAFNHPAGFVLDMGYDLSEIRETRALGRWMYAGAMGFVVVLGSILGWWAIRGPLGGIRSVGLAAVRITRDLRFGHRVPQPTGSRETDQMAAAFNAMLDKIATLIQSQKDVMDNIAHDIRSPVARMRSAAEPSLERPETRALAGQVIEDCDQILHLINVLLEISATEAGTVQWTLRTLDPAEVVAEAAELFAPILESKDQSLTLKLAEGLRIQADPRVFQRVISNLLDNAVKYTPAGGSIEVWLERDGGDLVFRVKDSGIGISERDLPAIYNRFFRGDASRTEPGSGLGLSFCQAAVKAMGGVVSCESKLGMGTRFTVRIPIGQT